MADEDCANCHGGGTVMVDQINPNGVERVEIICPICGGSGLEL